MKVPHIVTISTALGGMVCCCCAEPPPSPTVPATPKQQLAALAPGIDAKDRLTKQLYLALLLHAREYDQGAAFYKKHFQKEKADVTVHLLYYRLLREGGQRGKCLAFLEGRVADFPELQGKVWLEKGIRYGTGELALAQYSFRMAMKHDPTSPDAYYALGMVTPDLVEKRTALTQAFSLLPADSALAREVLAALAEVQDKQQRK